MKIVLVRAVQMRMLLVRAEQDKQVGGQPLDEQYRQETETGTDRHQADTATWSQSKRHHTHRYPDLQYNTTTSLRSVVKCIRLNIHPERKLLILIGEPLLRKRYFQHYLNSRFQHEAASMLASIFNYRLNFPSLPNIWASLDPRA